jgi:hypothetical protein
VSAVGESTFEGCSALVSIELSNAVKIESRCFAGTPLTTIILPKVTMINGIDHFSQCPSLATISLPSLLSVDSASSLAIDSSNLASVFLPASPPTVKQTFAFGLQTKASLPSNDDYFTYDLADGPLRDGKFFSIFLDYVVVNVLAGGEEYSGMNIVHAVEKSGNSKNYFQEIGVTEGFLFSDNFPLSMDALKKLIIWSSVSFSSIPANAFSQLSNLEIFEVKGDGEYSLKDSAFKGCANLRALR